MNSKCRVSDEQIKQICLSSKSMASASVILDLHFNTFKRRAVKLGCYHTNQSGKGLSKTSGCKTPIGEILEGKHPEYQTFKLKNRLIEDGIKQNQCEICSLTEWLGKPLNCELDHINGKRHDHRLENLRMICPNCHSQTGTYRSKNRVPKRKLLEQNLSKSVKP